MNKSAVLARYGQPFSFDTKIEHNDTIMLMYYKTRKNVLYHRFIVSYKLITEVGN